MDEEGICMKKTVISFLFALVAISLSGCASMSTQSYSASGFVHNNTDSRAFMDFNRFKGNMNFTLEAEGSDRIHYSACLEEGSAVVYVKSDDGKEELFTVEAGEDIDSSFMPKSGDVHLEFVADDTCRGGKVSFEIEEEL